jgi:purine nucleosidase
MHKLILDTDIGTDVDDLLALSFMLASPEVDVLGITTAYGDTRLRAKIVRRALELTGQTDIPIAAGPHATFEGNREVWMAGHEGDNARISELSDNFLHPLNAPAFILETIRAHPGEVILCAVAPLTNLAHACEKDLETMRQVKHIYLMGGVFGFNNPSLTFPSAEHNIRSDPEAARVVFEAGLPITLFPLDVTLQTPLASLDVTQIKSADTPLAAFLDAEMSTWLRFIRARFDRDQIFLHDPLTVAAVVDSGIVTRSLEVGIQIECQGEISSGATVPYRGANKETVEVVMEVDLSRFYELYLARAAGPQVKVETV